MKIIKLFSYALTVVLYLGSHSIIAQINQSSFPPSNCVASPEPLVVQQPNGSSITVIGKGNMNNNWTETIDGYSIKRNSNGNYEYATKQNGKLVPNGTLASDPSNRTAAENAFVTSLQPSLKPDMNPLKASILNQVNAHLQNKTYPTSGNVRVLALLIDYPDLTNVLPKADFDSLLYGDNYRNGDGSFKTFYETSSGGQLTVTVDVKGWYRAANNYLYYAADSGYDRAAGLVKEAVDAAELAGTDFSLYDNDSDGDVDGILAVHSGPGAEIGSQTQYIWSHRWNFFSAGIGGAFYDGVSIADYMINPETRSAFNSTISGIGVFCHEFGHNLGLPDLYDTDPSNGDSEGIGNWCLMAGGGYLGNSNRPANFSAWCRIEHGWDTPTQLTIGNTGIYTLDTASTSRNEILQINTSLPNEYFLLENRQQAGLDSDIPGSGLAIWHINTTKTNAFGNSVNADETLKGVDLEEADGNDDLDNEVNRGDGGDLYPGTSNNTTFNNTSTPNSQTYNLTNTNLELRNISNSGGMISFDFGKAPGPPCAASTALTSATGTFDDGSGAGLDYVNNQSCSWLIQPVGASSVTLSFSSFDTQAGIDLVNVYDGNNNTAPLLGSFSGNSIPANVSSTGSSMYVEFTSDATISGPGWEANYVSLVPAPSCSGTTTLTTASGSFSDGSGASNYSDNLNCAWLIQPTGAASITLDFTQFDVDPLIDRVIIYDGIDFTAPVLGSYTGNSIPPTVNSTGSSLYMEFTTNGSMTAAGWSASYTSSPAGPTCSGNITLTTPTGTFSDGSGPSNYDNNLNCSWLIQPPGAASITFGLSSLNTEISTDRIIVYDGPNGSAPQLGSFSGTNNLNTLTSSGGSMFIEFITNSSVTDQGWDAFYTSSTSGPGCSGATTLTANSGSFSDGSMANNYGNNQFCSWLIQPSATGNITLSFSAFDTEANLDRVLVFDGMDNTAPQIGNFSGSSIPSNLTSSSNVLYIEFRTNGTNTAQGWDASYTAASSSCSGTTTLTAANGTFNDGSGSGSNYANNLNCSWLIQPPGAASITFGLSSLNTEISNDRVIVYDGTSNSAPQLGSYSGTNNLNTFTSSGGSIFVEFITNGSVTDVGWDAFYTSTTSGPGCSGATTLNANSGSFSDGSMGNNYGNNQFCTWLIQPAATGTITLSFSAFDTEASLDRVLVFDGVDNTAPQIGNFSGTTIPANLTSTSNVMYIEFRTNGTNTAQGWDASYVTNVTTTCSGNTTLVATSGTFSDGSGANNYDNNLNCTWLIQPVTPPALITLNMTSMNLVGIGDRVNVYDGTSTAGTFLGSYLFSNTTSVYNATSGSMFIEFVTDANNTAQGWDAAYTTSSTYCLPNTTFTNNFGTFSDGSPFGQNYLDNTTCEWLIQPATPGVAVSLRFNQFQTEINNDLVTIYDGSTTSDPVLATFSGNAIPPTVTSSAGEMLVVFSTNGSITDNGWQAQYQIQSIPFCAGQTNLNSASGTFDDGSGSGPNYIQNSNCSWLISPPGAINIDLSFNYFDTEANFDVLSVYDGMDNTGTLLGTYSGNTIPPNLTALSGSMFLEFTSDNFNNADGWEASYTSSNTIIVDATVDTVYINAGVGSTASFNLNSNVSWSTSDNGSWLIATPINGNGNSTINLLAIQANIGPERSAEVYINGLTGSLNNDTVVVIQRTSGRFIDANPDTLFFTATAPPSQNISLNTNVTWNLATTSPWINFTPSTGSNTGSPSVSVQDNTTNLIRNGFIVISGNLGAMNDTVFVVQDSLIPPPPSLSVDPSNLVLPQQPGTFASFTVNSTVVWQTQSGASWLDVLNPAVTSDTNTVQIQTNSLNASTMSRNSFVAVQDVGGTLFDTVFVEQLGGILILSATPRNVTLNQPALSNTIVNLDANINWTATPSAAWIDVTPTSGTNTTVLNVQANSANTSTSTRSSFIALDGGNGAVLDTIFVDQNGIPLQMSVTPKSITLDQPMNSLDSFTVNSNVTWQVSSGASWLTVNPPFNSFDTNKVEIVANSDNMTTSIRSTFVAVQDAGGTLFDTVFVSQLGTTPVLQGSPDTITLAATNGSSSTLNIVASDNWTAVEGDTWFSINQANGTGSTSLVATALMDNMTGSQRVSYIAFEDAVNTLVDTVVVIQEFINTSGLTTTPDTIRIGSALGSSNTFDVNTTLNWSAIVLGPLPFISLSQSGGTGNATVTVSAISPNTSLNERSTIVEVSSTGSALNIDSVWVVQEGILPVLTATPNSLNLNFSSGSNDVVNLTANVPWTVTNPASWLTVGPMTGNGNETLTFTANSDNLTGANRTATVSIDGVGGVSVTVTVTQIDGSTPSFEVSKDTVFVDNPQGSTGTFSILSNVSSWSLAENTSWLLVNPTSGAGTQLINVLVATRNVIGVPRYAEIIASSNGFPDKVIVIAQEESTPLFQIAPSVLVLGADSSSLAEFNISSNMTSWSISENASWLEVDPIAGSFTQKVTATAVEDNNTGAQRTEVITITAPPLVPQTVMITQDTARAIGIDENSFEQSFELYPNPTSSTLTIKIGNEFVGNSIDARLYNMIGEEIPVEIDFSTKNSTIINLDNQANGIYFLMTRYKGKVFSRKISLIK